MTTNDCDHCPDDPSFAPTPPFPLPLRAPTLTEDVAANGSVHLSYWGRRVALGFHGTADFVERGFNLAHNRGMTALHGRLHFPFCGEQTYGYVVVEDREAIRRGLISQFRSEIVANGEAVILREILDEETGEYTVEFDEDQIAALAAQRAEHFLTNVIITDHFLAHFAEERKGLAPVYETAGFAGGARAVRENVGEE